MGLSCGSRLAKCILFVFNIIFWLAGACLLGVGIWFLVDKDAASYLDVATTEGNADSVRAAAVVLVIVGVIVFVTGGFGCLGAIRESPCMLTTYVVLLILLLIMQVVAGIVAVVFKNDIIDGLEESLNKTMDEQYGVEGNDAITKSWDFVQVELACCGSRGPTDWASTEWRKQQTGNDSAVVPKTCCVLTNDDSENPEPKDYAACQAEVATPSEDKTNLNTEGCHEALEDWVGDHAGILIGMAFGLLVIQVIGIILACCLKKSIVSEYKTV